MKITHSPLLIFLLVLPVCGWCQEKEISVESFRLISSTVFISLLVIVLLILNLILRIKKITTPKIAFRFNKEMIEQLDKTTVKNLIDHRLKHGYPKKLAVLLYLLLPVQVFAQTETQPSLFSQWGIIITMVLIAIPLLFATLFALNRVKSLINKIDFLNKQEEANTLANYIQETPDKEIDKALDQRLIEIEYKVPSLLHTTAQNTQDSRGILQSVHTTSILKLASEKAKQKVSKELIPQGNLILWYLGCAVFWLIFGTTVGEYLGIKFVSPEADSISWLSFGRLRPVHTNAVFWGWSSLAMLGLAYYVVPKVSNTTLASIKKGWITLVLINASVIIGTLCLMNGINNGGGEYREYIWPVMGLFGLGLGITLINFIQTIAKRKSEEIYISNWYIVSALIFTLVIAFIAYWPTWQNGLGETIVQGYYMHQGVGMWFMLFNLGLVYYFLPQQVNRPIYSYGLGILAFWSQIVFYTLIGTHHFVFSSIPWWLQTVAIVGSVGMIIPVVAGTTNFYMTFKGAWHKMSLSYTLPFFFVGILFYFTGSLQGTAEAFRYTNLLWHFTDFTVAHSHLTMYGIIAFLLWGCIYVLVPRITGKEPSQLLTGMHFWLAFIGLMFYTIPLMIGGTLKGMAWMEGKYFIETVTMMAPYWLWRAIGGSLMWLSHIVFAINFYKMVTKPQPQDVAELTVQKLKQRLALTNP